MEQPVDDNTNEGAAEAEKSHEGEDQPGGSEFVVTESMGEGDMDEEPEFQEMLEEDMEKKEVEDGSTKGEADEKEEIELSQASFDRIKGEDTMEEETDLTSQASIDCTKGEDKKEEETDLTSRASIDCTKGEDKKEEETDPTSQASIDHATGESKNEEETDPTSQASIDCTKGESKKEEETDPTSQASIDCKKGEGKKEEKTDTTNQAFIDLTTGEDKNEEETDSTNQATKNKASKSKKKKQGSKDRRRAWSRMSYDQDSEEDMEEEDLRDNTMKGETKREAESKKSVCRICQHGDHNEIDCKFERIKCSKCKHPGHDHRNCTWSSVKMEDGFFRISNGMLEWDSKQKMLRNVVHVAGVGAEDFPQMCDDLMADILYCHWRLLAGSERRWYVEMIFSSEDTAQKVLGSLPDQFPKAEVEKHGYHTKVEGAECLRNKQEFHPSAVEGIPTDGHLLFISAVSHENFKDIFEKWSQDIISLKFELLSPRNDEGKFGYCETMFATAEAVNEAHDFMKSCNPKVEMQKHSSGRKPLGKNLKEKYKVDFNLALSKKGWSKFKQAKKASSKTDLAKEEATGSDKEMTTSQSKEKDLEDVFDNVIYIAPLSFEDMERLIEATLADILTWKVEKLVAHDNKMFVELLCSSRYKWRKTSEYVLAHYPEADVEIPAKIANSAVEDQPGEEVRRKCAFDRRITHRGTVIALLSSELRDINHEDLSQFWKALPNALDIFAPKSDDGKFKRYVLVWLRRKDIRTCVIQNVFKISGTLYLVAEKINTPQLEQLYSDMDKILKNNDENAALSMKLQLHKKLDLVNYFLHWAGDFEFQKSNRNHQKELRKYLGSGLSKIQWCHGAMGGPHGGSKKKQGKHGHKRAQNNFGDDFGGKRSRQESKSNWNSYQASSFSSKKSPPNANFMQMNRNPTMGNWQPPMGMGNMGNMPQGNMNAGNMNMGNMNMGNMNPGNMNMGNMNPGNMHMGNMNPGNMNMGNMNPGNMNMGNMNPGNMHMGNMNPGNMNMGNMNPGNMHMGIMNPSNMNMGNMPPPTNMLPPNMPPTNMPMSNIPSTNMPLYNMPSTNVPPPNMPSTSMPPPSMSTGSGSMTGNNYGFNQQNAGYFSNNASAQFSEKSYQPDAYNRPVATYNTPTPQAASSHQFDQPTRPQLDPFDATQVARSVSRMDSESKTDSPSQEQERKKRAIKLLYGLTELLK